MSSSTQKSLVYCKDVFLMAAQENSAAIRVQPTVRYRNRSTSIITSMGLIAEFLGVTVIEKNKPPLRL